MLLALIIMKKTNNRMLKAFATVLFINSALNTGFILWAKLTKEKENTQEGMIDLTIQADKSYKRLDTLFRTNEEV